MAWLRGNLHAHTTYSDGVKTPQELLADYEALGYEHTGRRYAKKL